MNFARCFCIALVGAAVSCSPKPPESEGASEELWRIGSIAITEADLEHYLRERSLSSDDVAARQRAMAELFVRARMAQVALDAGLADDPVVRAEVARVLGARLRETQLDAKLRELNVPVAEARLRELYGEAEDRFRSEEKRQVAVLWLDPKGNPEREQMYQQKLAAAKTWVSEHPELRDHPQQGFSVLGVDHSEHQASRYKKGILPWIGRQGSGDEWSKAVAEIAFTLAEPGDVSPLVSRAEGVFLVRLVARQEERTQPFEAVRGQLEEEERRRLHEAVEEQFHRQIEAEYPIPAAAGP